MITGISERGIYHRPRDVTSRQDTAGPLHTLSNAIRHSDGSVLVRTVLVSIPARRSRERVLLIDWLRVIHVWRYENDTSCTKKGVLAIVIELAVILGVYGHWQASAAHRGEGTIRTAREGSIIGGLAGAGGGLGSAVKGALIGAGAGAGTGYLVQRHRNKKSRVRARVRR